MKYSFSNVIAKTFVPSVPSSPAIAAIKVIDVKKQNTIVAKINVIALKFFIVMILVQISVLKHICVISLATTTLHTVYEVAVSSIGLRIR